ncbi:hypothetical protein FQA39_LY01088 [Lamprigera yunnana]|nr:hypothetical protein FQA39_LY01088 [Lamprigera yunnana]
MISNSGFRIAVGDQENKTLSARKPVPKSVRKPLGDRAINQTPIQKRFQLKTLKDCNVNIQKVEDTDMVKKNQKVYPEWYADVCSFKEVTDNYEGSNFKLDYIKVSEVINFMINPKTPPINNDNNNGYVTPPLYSYPKKQFNYDDIDDIMEIPIVDVGIPEFSF